MSFNTSLHFAELLADLERQVRANNERIELLNQYHHALSNHLQKLLNGEEIEVNSDGSLRNEKAEAAIREYEDIRHTKIDRLNPTDVKAALDNFVQEREFIIEDNDQVFERVPELAHLGINTSLDLDTSQDMKIGDVRINDIGLKPLP